MGSLTVTDGVFNDLEKDRVDEESQSGWRRGWAERKLRSGPAKRSQA